MNIVFHSSIPRSGSTLLQNLLAQNPRLHPTPTNNLLDIMMRVRDTWMQLDEFKAQGLNNIQPRIEESLRGMMRGFYASEFIADKIVIDKCHGWIGNIELIERLLKRKMKIIVMVRDIREVLASFEVKFRQSAITGHPLQGEEVLRSMTIQGRSERLCALNYKVGYMIGVIRDCIARGLKDRLVIVTHKQLTCRPVETVQRICVECGLPVFVCDPMNVEQVVQEDDTVYGMNFHKIEPIVKPWTKETWRGILPEDYAKHIDKTYQDIQRLANGI